MGVTKHIPRSIVTISNTASDRTKGPIETGDRADVAIEKERTDAIRVK